MSVRIAYDSREEIAVLYCSTSGHAFGPIFEGDDPKSDAEEFLQWLREEPRDTSGARILGDGTDARDYPADHLEELVRDWKTAREDGPELDGQRVEGGRITPMSR